ncbi:MAG: PilZ domain-containing protein [Magnetococcales bacterium]|nr:PilZ domain-containing protein [Magnetococcales bacterium]
MKKRFFPGKAAPGPVIAEQSPQQPSRRQWPRESAAIPMVLVVDAGKRRLSGISKDVSLGGAALTLAKDPEAIQPDQEAKVEIQFEGSVYRYTCRILRATGTQVFVAMDEKNRAQFASLISLMELSSIRDNFNLLNRWDSTRGTNNSSGR